jgi:Nif-specific regulatory protein
MLAHHFLQRACHVIKKSPITFSDCAIKRMRSYDWPGNIRELSNIIERAVVLTRGDTIVADDLLLLPPSLSSENATTRKSYYDQVRAFQKELLRQALQKSGGSQAKAAERLCLQRTYIARLIKKLNVQ